MLGKEKALKHGLFDLCLGHFFTLHAVNTLFFALYFTALNAIYHVSLLDGLKSVSDDHEGLLTMKSVNGFHDSLFGVIIKS